MICFAAGFNKVALEYAITISSAAKAMAQPL
jgi:hypothetical protein